MIVSAAKKINIVIVLCATLCILSLALYSDITSRGLRGTQFYMLFGVLSYPLFYGLGLALIVKLIYLYHRSSRFVFVDGTNLMVWSKKIPLNELKSIEVQSVLFAISRIVIHVDGGADVKISSLALAEPIDKVAQRLRELAKVP